MSEKQRHRGGGYAKYGYLFSIPFALSFLIFSLYPTVYTLILGFTDCCGLGSTEWHILDDPLENFRNVMKSRMFITSLKNTVMIWLMNFLPQITIALLLTAMFTSRRSKLKGKSFFKAVFYMPNMITAAAVAILFKALFAYPVGPVNDILRSVNIRDNAYDFLTNGTASRLITAFIQFWIWYGNTMIILISGVLGINPDIFDAAEIDGANGIQTFFRITLPNLKTILLYTLVTSLVGGLNMYDIPKVFLDGGPDNATLTTSVYIQKQAFSGSYLYNKAAAASMIMWGIIAVCSVFLFLIMRDKGDDAVSTKKKRRKHIMKQGEGKEWQ